MILEELDVWPLLIEKATAIDTIHISQKGSFGRSLLKAADYDLPALGYVISYGALSQALDTRLAKHANIALVHEAEATALYPRADKAEIEYRCQTQTHALSAGLAVVADGGGLHSIAGMQRVEKAYGHDALVARVSTEWPHQNIAYERFTAQGPMALLPNGKDFTLVWTGTAETIQPLLMLDDDIFLSQLHATFGDRVGRFTGVSKRMTFPLRLATLKPPTAPHVAVIGNAAQTMHPVAGQGFNVGLRDAQMLAQEILHSRIEEYGSASMLEHYQRARMRDTQRGLRFTDTLVRLFSNDYPGLSAARALGLTLFDLAPSVKHYMVNKMSLGAGS
jgi:2-octaprenyl-6-methoxyphenol hydroxylase